MALGTAFETNYHQLAAAWLRHDDLHRRGASIDELFASRQRLDALRRAVAAARHGITI
jgi:hypothetical protein